MLCHFFDTGSTFVNFIESIHFKHERPMMIARGAYGNIYYIEKDGKQYILKHIKTYPRYKYRSLQESVNNEINILLAVDGSPFVVKLLAAIVLSTEAYLLFPYVPGSMLTDWLDAHPEKTDRMRVYNQLLEGIEYIHSKGIIHRDVKPDNIWVPDDPTLPAFYLDFGISVPNGSNMEYFGTNYYMPYGTVGSKGKQTVDLNYYALNKIFIDNPLPNSIKMVKAGPGTRYARRRRNSRRQRTRRSKLTV